MRGLIQALTAILAPFDHAFFDPEVAVASIKLMN